MATRYKIINVDAGVTMTELGKRSFTWREAEAMAVDLKSRGYTVRIEVDGANAPLKLTRRDVGSWIAVKDPSGRVQWGGVYKVISVGRVNVRASQDVRFSPTGPWYHQTHTIPMSHVQRLVPVDEIAFHEGDEAPR
jgi:hypothetical protein